MVPEPPAYSRSFWNEIPNGLLFFKWLYLLNDDSLDNYRLSVKSAADHSRIVYFSNGAIGEKLEFFVLLKVDLCDVFSPVAISFSGMTELTRNLRSPCYTLVLGYSGMYGSKLLLVIAIAVVAEFGGSLSVSYPAE